ncbi:MAG: helix-turn-helix domain-containing protein, partial [Usitatibacteraceae bacterium]
VREPKSETTRLVADCLWCVSDATADGYETILPSGRAQIMISLSGTRLNEHGPEDGHQDSGSLHVFQGPSTMPRRVSRKAQTALCGVSFQPGGAGALFGPIQDTTDQVIDLSQFWADAAVRLRDRLRNLETHDAVLDLLEKEIERRIGDVSAAIVLKRGIECMRTGMAIRDVAEELEISLHVFRKLFLRNVGLTPKRYLRIERFRAAINLLSSASSLSEVAFDAQFSDQSHMTREVEHFASMTPRCLRACVRPYVGHVLGPAR